MKLHLFNNVFIDHIDHLWIETGSKIIVVSSNEAGELETNPNCLNYNNQFEFK